MLAELYCSVVMVVLYQVLTNVSESHGVTLEISLLKFRRIPADMDLF